MSGRTFHLVEGIKRNTARWSLKMELEAFGKVESCHMGDRDNPDKQPAWAKFATREGAEKAFEAIAARKVYVNGVLVRAEWRKEAAPPAPVEQRSSRGDLDINSRDLFLATAQSSGARKSRKKRSSSSSSSSRSRKRRREKEKDRGRRSRDRGRRSRSRKKDDKPREIKDKDDRPQIKDKDRPPVPMALADVPHTEKSYCRHRLTGSTAAKCDFCSLEQSPAVMLGCKVCSYDVCRSCVDKSTNFALE